jgi:FADH2 O2-dependent halogenase
VCGVELTAISADIAIIGAGFGGSLMALLAKRIGMRPVLIERGSHPRFMIGESSTPQGDLVLADLARRYRLPRIEPLCAYGSWKRSYPELVCGLKRGFSYFHHVEGKAFEPSSDHANELLVAASRDDEHSDTHWLRSDFDAFLVDEVRAEGIPYFDRTELIRIDGADTWRLEGRTSTGRVEFEAPFVVDASGQSGVLASALGIANDVAKIGTSSRSIYAHFEGIPTWTELYEGAGGRSDDHPFPCHAAALHHIFEGGWMYVLRFDNGVTSAGFCLDDRKHPLDLSRRPQREWDDLLRRFPSIAAQFERAVPLTPVVRTGRMQRRVARAAGDNWAMLPAAACFLDPLHSAGNALTLVGIERLVGVLESEGRDRVDGLANYEHALFRDVDLLDRFIDGCYSAFGHFDLMVSYAMLYFAGAHYGESLRRRDPSRSGLGFLNSQDAHFRGIVSDAFDELRGLTARADLSESEVSRFRAGISDAIRPYNLAGLCDSRKRNMYECV